MSLCICYKDFFKYFQQDTLFNYRHRMTAFQRNIRQYYLKLLKAYCPSMAQFMELHLWKIA